MSELLLSIDVGTTAIKAACFTAEGSMLASAYTEYPLMRSQKWWVEQDANQWLTLSKKMIREVISDPKVDPSKIMALSISAQGISYVPVDDQGNPLRNAFSWLDTRAVEQTQKLFAVFEDQDHAFKCLGLQVVPTYTLPKIMWLKDFQPEVFDHAYKFSTCLDYLNKHFIDQFVTDYSIAGGTLAHEIQKMDWAHTILRQVGVPSTKFPFIDWAGTPLGNILPELANELSLPPKLKIILGGHDQECAALGAGIGLKDLTISLGTASILIAPVEKPVIDPELRIPCYPHIEKNQFVLEAVVSAAGVSFRWLRDLFNTISRGQHYQYDEIVEIAGNCPPGANGLKYFPHLSGATSPFWNPEATGVFSGISLDTSISEFARGLLEGWCYQLKTNLLVIEELTGSRENILVFGGGAKNPHFLRILANILGRPITVCSTPETALQGAAMLAGFGAGVYASLDEAKELVRKGFRSVENESALSNVYQSLYEDYRLLEDKLLQGSGL